MEYDYIEQGDCLKLMKQIPDGSVDLVVTDPPYVVETTGGTNLGNIKSYSDIKSMSNGFSENILDELCRIMKKINIYFFCSQKQIMPLLDYFVRGKGCNWNLLSWHKSNPVPACGNKYLTDTEFILFFREKGVKVFGEFSTKKTYYITPSNQKEKKQFGHPTVKPLEILQNLIINSSQSGDIVLDPFLGSGSTCVAAVSTNRHYIGFELDPKYFQVACDRLDEAEEKILRQKSTNSEQNVEMG